jgi:hypothetical protein
VLLERTATNRHRHVDLRCDRREIRLSPRLGEDRRVVAERAERVEEIAAAALHEIRGRVRDGVRAQAPQPRARRRDVVQPANVDRLSERLERAAEEIERLAVAKIGEAAARVQMIDVLRPAEERVRLDGAGGKSGDVVRQLLEQRERAAAAQIADVVRHRAARREGARASVRLHDLVSDEIADVRHDPLLARLDEPVFVELRDVALDEIHLLGDRAQQIAQRVALLLVALPVDDGEEIEETVDGATLHRCLHRHPEPRRRRRNSSAQLFRRRGPSLRSG